MVAKHTAAALGLLIASFGSASAQTFSSSAAAVSREASAVSSLSLATQGLTPASTALPRVFVPTLPRTTYTRYPWKTDIVATIFWIGESPTQNNPVPNDKSSWDPAWAKNYGGFDDPDPSQRGSNYCPVKFTPRQNPFYVALPYNDVINHETTKREAAQIIPWYKERFVKAGKSIVKGQWIAIRHGNRVCYAQWEDCGPFVTDDADYVFGDSRPKNKSNDGAGIDLSPAVRDYLGLTSGHKCDWRFVDLNEIPEGPWRDLGTNNHFVQNKTKAGAQQNDLLASRLEELRRMRDEYFRKNGNSQYLR